MMPLGTSATPCEQPAPARSAYSVRPMKVTSATPLTRLPSATLVWLDGRLSAITVRTPVRLTFEMWAVRPLVYGPTGATTCVHWPTVVVAPPRPPSATYRLPSGPKVRPRGLSKPLAKTVKALGVDVCFVCSATALALKPVRGTVVDESHAAANGSTAAAAQQIRR